MTNRHPKPPTKRVDGILLLDKPPGLTSNAALQRVKRLFNAKKAGHTGSLDPIATGMLPLAFGEATKLSQFLLESDKHYEVHAILGVRTQTADAEGEVISRCPVPDLTDHDLKAVLAEFTGQICQVPPMFSAIKHKGQPLYRLARKGIEVERTPREARIERLDLLQREETTFDVFVHCSKGTYVRTLIEDIGERLGCGAHVAGLRRTAVTAFRTRHMYTLAELENLQQSGGENALKACLLPIDSSVEHLPAVRLSPAAAFYLKTGQAVRVQGTPASGQARLYDEKGKFMGVGEVTEDGRMAPRRLLNASQ